MRSRLRWYVWVHGPWLGLMALITAQSCTAGVPLPSLGLTFMDKIAHFAIFAVLGFLLCRGMHAVTGLGRRYLGVALLIGAVFASSDEIHQLFVRSRSASLGDWLADLGGLVVAGLLYDLAVIPASERALTGAGRRQIEEAPKALLPQEEPGGSSRDQA